MVTVPNRRYLGRYREIASVLTRHGFGWLMAELKLRDLLPFRQRLGRTAEGAAEPASQAVQLRLAFEELGTTFIKVAQLLSTRSDLLPPEYVRELAKLQDAAPPVPIAQLVAVFEAELGARPEAVFAEFDPIPLATASIGQVHAARLRSGEQVVVKVQRPGVAAAVERDLEVLLDLARLVEHYTAFGRDYDVVGLAEEFAFTLHCELSYLREGQSADRFRQAFAEDPDLYVPRVYWEHTTERVIVLERLEGAKVNDLPAPVAGGIDPKKVAASSVRLMLEQMFVHGFFHADPHPGNLFVLADGRIGLLDFGMIGRLDEALQASLTRIFLAVSKDDADRLLDELRATGIVRGEVNQVALERDVDHMIACMRDRPVRDLAAARIFNEITALARRHHLRLPSDLVLMAKVMAMSEGLGLELDPDFQFIPFARPYLERFWLEKRSPRRVAERLAEGIVETAELGLTLPRHLRRLMTDLERGDVRTQVELRGADRFLAELHGMTNRLAMSVLVGGLLVGLSLFLHMLAPAGLESYAGRFFGLSFVAAVVLGFWLLKSLLRSGRRWVSRPAQPQLETERTSRGLSCLAAWCTAQCASALPRVSEWHRPPGTNLATIGSS